MYWKGFVNFRLLILLPIGLIIVLCNETLADTNETQRLEQQGWSLVLNKNDIQVYNRDDLDADTYEILTLTKIESTPARVFAVITDYDRYPEFMPNFTLNRIEDSHQNTQWIYQRLSFKKEFFLLSDRHFVVKNTLIEPEADQQIYRVEWSIDKDRTNKIEVSEDDVVVVPNRNTGYWELRPTKGGFYTDIRYYLNADPGGLIPNSVNAYATTKSIPKVIEAIRNRIASPIYDTLDRE